MVLNLFELKIVCTHDLKKHIYLSPLKGFRSNDTSLAMSTSSTHILVSRNHSPFKGTSC